MKSRLNLARFLMLSVAVMVFASAASTFAADAKADATGTWKWSMPARGNQPARDVTLKLKQDGEKLTGTISATDKDVDIQDGKVSNGEVSFKVVRKRNDQEITSTYVGKVDGDTLKMKVDSNFNGQSRSREVEAKRSKE